jgi:hypothetical protein
MPVKEAMFGMWLVAWHERRFLERNNMYKESWGGVSLIFFFFFMALGFELRAS